MTSEPNLLNRITITIEANNQQVAKKVLHGSLLNQASINKLLNSYFDGYDIYQDIALEKLTLDLGEISFHDFNSLFPARLKVALNKALSQYQTNNPREETLLNKPTSNKFTDRTYLSSENHLIDAENFIHFLSQKGPQFNPMEVITDNKNSDIKIKPLINQLMQIENQSALLLAKSCLSEQGLQRLLAIRQPALLVAINRRLSARINKPQHQEERVSSGQLILNALEYIQQHNTQEIPKPDAKIISRITTELDNGVLNAAPVITSFRQAITRNIRLNKIPLNNIPLNRWLKQLWQTVSVSQLCKKHLPADEYQYLLACFTLNHTDKNISDKKPTMTPVDIANIQTYQHQANQPVITDDQKIVSAPDKTPITGNHYNPHQTINRPHSGRTLLSEQSLPYPINNAGILILWPMLPALFNQLGLLEKQKFIHRQTQLNAVDLLDHLIWGTEEKPAERKLLNYVLCGLIADKDIESIPIEPEKQLIADQWLDAVTGQLTGWKKLSRNDVRQLFLQRPGELLTDEQEIKITIQQQPFDALLIDWPWPLNIARLPWLDRPLRIDWQNI
ncbi:contractile injection system tape measure protein [Photorhabdus africana]|uniref:contractile injection system tape measure protein n=1 Tax=Photorhabdus africana TaxID=3097554 RepID=UPI002B417161|nr:contractile injection system tape measure protein [Photorhabdus sp. CRI-LC]